MHYLIWTFLCFWFLEAVCWEKSSTKFLCTYAQILMLINYKLQSRTDLAYFTFWEKEKWFPKYTCGNLIFSPYQNIYPDDFCFLRHSSFDAQFQVFSTRFEGLSCCKDSKPQHQSFKAIRKSCRPAKKWEGRGTYVDISK